MANILSDEIKKEGYTFLINSPSNQIFPILPNTIINELQKKYLFYVWEKVDDDNSAIHLVTSWATEESKVHEFISELKKLCNKNI